MTPCNFGYSPTPMLTTRTSVRGKPKRLGRIDYRKECRIIRHETAVSHFNALAVTGEDKLLLEEWIG